MAKGRMSPKSSKLSKPSGKKLTTVFIIIIIIIVIFCVIFFPVYFNSSTNLSANTNFPITSAAPFNIVPVPVPVTIASTLPATLPSTLPATLPSTLPPSTLPPVIPQTFPPYTIVPTTIIPNLFFTEPFTISGSLTNYNSNCVDIEHGNLLSSTTKNNFGWVAGKSCNINNNVLARCNVYNGNLDNNPGVTYNIAYNHYPASSDASLETDCINNRGGEYIDQDGNTGPNGYP